MKNIFKTLVFLAAALSIAEAVLAADVAGHIRIAQGGMQDRRDVRQDQGRWDERDAGGYWGPMSPYGNVISVPVVLNRYLQGSTQTVVPDYDLNRFRGYEIIGIDFDGRTTYQLYNGTKIGFNINGRWIGETVMFSSGGHIEPVGHNIIGPQGVRVFFATVDDVYMGTINFTLRRY